MTKTERVAAMRAYSKGLNVRLEEAGRAAVNAALSERLDALLDAEGATTQRARALGVYAPRVAPVSPTTPPKSQARPDRFLRQIANRVLGA